MVGLFESASSSNARVFERGGLADRAESHLADVLASLVLFPVSTTYLLSYTALIYSGPLAFGRPAGLFAMLATTFVAGVITALASSFKVACGALDNNATAIMATIAAAIAIEMGPDADRASLLATVIAEMAIAGLVAGGSLLAIGWLRAGGIVRLMPLQVMAGFLGTTGWILSAGAAKVSAGHALNWEIFSDHDVDFRLAAMTLIALAFGFLAKRFKSPFVTPLLIGAFILAHHALFSLLGLSLATQRDSGWLIAFPKDLEATIPWSPEVFGRVDWTALGRQSLALGVLALVAPMSLLLTATGLETSLHEEVDINRELRVGGLSSLVSGAAGGTIGFITFARSLTLREAGSRSRLAPTLTAVLTGVVPFACPSVLGFIPVTVLGGLLFYLGANLLYRWVYATKREMTFGEWVTIPIVIVLSIQFGVIYGVFAGLLIGCVNFVASYGVSPPVRASCYGDVAVSNVWRSYRERRVLEETAQQRLVLYLQGFVFFGTTNRLLKEIQERLESKTLRALILDFGEVDGFDSSALSSFRRILRICAERGVTLLFTAAPQDLAERLEEVDPGKRLHLAIVSSLEEALERSEEGSLREAGIEPGEPKPLSESLAADCHDANMAALFLEHFSWVDFPAGAALMEQGDASDHLAFIESGRASVFESFEGQPPIRIRTLVAGTMIGELGFCVDTPRTATIRAETDCRLLRITKDDLKRLEAERPQAALAFHSLIAKRLCRRIRDKDHLIASLVRGAKRSAP